MSPSSRPILFSRKWWKGFRDERDLSLYHVTRMDPFCLDRAFSRRYGELPAGLPAYMRPPGPSQLLEGQSVYHLIIPRAITLRAAADLVVNDDDFTEYDVEVSAQARRWGYHAVARPEGLESLIKGFEEDSGLKVGLIFYSGYLGIVRDLSLIASYSLLES